MNFKKSTIYKRLFLTYTFVILFIVSALDIYFIKLASDQVKKNNLYITEKIIQSVEEFINYDYNTTNVMMNMLYQDNFKLKDVVNYLKSDLPDYLKEKLDSFSDSDKIFYNGTEYFIKTSFSLNNSLKTISLYSYPRQEISIFDNKGQVSIKKFNSDTILRDGRIPEIIVNEDNSIAFTREIRDIGSLQSVGILVANYDLKKINNILTRYGKYEDNNLQVLILDSTGKIIYDSSNKNNLKQYAYFNQVKNGASKIVNEDRQAYYVKTLNNSLGLTIVGQINAKYAERLPILFEISAIIIGIVLFLISEGILYIKFKKLSDRMSNIVTAMNEVEQGNLNIKIPITGESDEINFIAEKFNEMCSSLDDYIKKSYLSELNQKRAEIVALQNQINPHFLYNTLESIRMKAICNGDKDVGKMLYSLAFLFRSQVKEKIIISIKQEIEYCKKYLELFKFRYDNKFKFIINCEEDLYDKQIIKFTLQPLIENYFVHGITLEKDDNELNINIFKKENNIVIDIVDNGRGISKEKLEDINKRLKNLDYSGKSIGMLNVHERIVINYGKQYGLKVKNGVNGGTVMEVTFPCREVED
ncbi:sensor histidine kinase [Clostridium tarantellae]|uniref:Sensor histidine kinase n=1 Tax=Clostridium tarantellae TaxID=39493 RepID=A0A6I1MRL2_9CLOT|nr:histidine kinase [Clostridium tarantellae]MPQ44837.1 sensor histidine kinase [Clostridium tarantellae]